MPKFCRILWVKQADSKQHVTVARQNDVPGERVSFARDLWYVWWFLSKPDFRDATPCSMINKHQYFRGNCYLLLRYTASHHWKHQQCTLLFSVPKYILKPTLHSPRLWATPPNCGIIPSFGNRLQSYPKCPDCLWNPPSLLLN